MRLIVDTNRIMAALIKDSVSRKIINRLAAELLTIGFSDKEIEKYKYTILRKSGLTETGLQILLEKLREKMIVVSEAIIESKMRDAQEIMDSIDPDDAPFIAAALATHSEIWSDDPHFERQKKVNMWKTKDLAKLV